MGRGQRRLGFAFAVFSEVVREVASVPEGVRREELRKHEYNFSEPQWWPNAVNYTTVINPDVDWGKWEGWGTSLCWWANVFGQRDDLADLLFTPSTLKIGELPLLPGLALNIARYNAGGSSNAPAGGDHMQASKNFPVWKQIQGFWENWDSEEPTSPSWNWSADANQVAMLKKAVYRGVNLPTLFSNSPMWWMCYDHNPSGSPTGLTDNLQSWNYRQHAVYLASVAAHAKAAWGITFNSAEPFNEPASDWWNALGTQEGCKFSPSTQATVLPFLREELDNRGLEQVTVAASDENTYTLALSTWNSFGDDVKAVVGRVNVHGYEQGGGRRDLLKEAAGSKQLWNSEYGDGDGSGLSMATNLHLDLRWLHNTAWVYWQALDGGGWGLLETDVAAGAIHSPNTKYYVLAQYTRHIRPGMLIIDGGEANTVAAVDPNTHKLVIITVNYNAEQWITYDLSKFPKVGGAVSRWCTNIDGGDMYREYHDTTVQPGGSFTVRFAANTIQTFEVSQVAEGIVELV